MYLNSVIICLVVIIIGVHSNDDVTLNKNKSVKMSKVDKSFQWTLKPDKYRHTFRQINEHRTNRLNCIKQLIKKKQEFRTKLRRKEFSSKRAKERMKKQYDKLNRRLKFLRHKRKNKKANALITKWCEKASQLTLKTSIIDNALCLLMGKKCAHACNNNKCLCFRGFRLAKDEKRCLDINECLIHNGGCDHKCTNKPGYHECHCNVGYTLGPNRKSCIDRNECSLRNGHGPCQDTCVNTPGSYYCSCNKLSGTVLSADKLHCDDVDECLESNGNCSHDCINFPQGYLCTCPSGYHLMEDSKTCEDVDECKISIYKDRCLSECVNSPGSYNCLPKRFLVAKNVWNKGVCKLLPDIKEPFYYKCSDEFSIESELKFISNRTLMLSRPGKYCNFYCKKDDKKLFMVYCDLDGEWIGFNNIDLDNICN